MGYRLYSGQDLNNKSPQEIVDFYHYKNKASFESFGISFDYYGRTSSSIHRQTSQDMFRVISKKGVFVLKSDDQLYDPQAKMFLADRFVRGTCPSCNYEEAYGDQCEKCGISLSPSDLIDPKSAITNAIPIKKESTHWYLPLAKSQKDLEKWIDKSSGVENKCLRANTELVFGRIKRSCCNQGFNVGSAGS